MKNERAPTREKRDWDGTFTKMSNEKKLTPEKLKTFKGLENLTDESAKYLSEQINSFARLLIKIKPLKKNESQQSNDNG